MDLSFRKSTLFSPYIVKTTTKHAKKQNKQYRTLAKVAVFSAILRPRPFRHSRESGNLPNYRRDSGAL
ncbi:MAG: hypothetical protein ACR2P4_08000 [Gammaproteobacteria bacterium]